MKNKNYSKTRNWLLLLCFLFGSTSAFAQQTVSGKVTSAEDQEGIPGVNIIEKGTSNGTVTDVSGNYTISVSSDAILVFSAVGFTTEEVVVNNQSNIDLEMTTNVQQLEELVVIGFGTQDRKDVTGAISSVSGKQLNEIPVPSLEQGLVGRAAGVQVTTGSGTPGAGASIRVRGIGSTNNAEPLYVIDGIIIGNVTGGGQTSISPLALINPNDIESIDILKDASATAIYGARAGNGVVIITTKRGQEGKVNVNYDAYTSTNVLDRSRFDMLSGLEWANFYNTMMIEADNPNYTGRPFVDKVLAGENVEMYDWFDYAYRDGSIDSHNLSITAGNEKSQLFASANYFNQEGIFPNSDLRRYTFRINSDTKVGSRLKIGNTLALSRSEANTVGNANPNGNTKDWIGRLLAANPYKPIFDPADGDYAGLSAQDPDAEAQLDYLNEHPIWNMEQDYDRETRNRIWGSLYADLTIVDGLVFHTMGSIDWSFNKDEFRGPFNTIDGAANSDETTSRLNFGSRESRTWFIENTLKYDKGIGDHNLSFMAGYQAQNNLNKGISTSAGAFVDNQYWFYSRPVLNQEVTDGDGNILATFPLVIPGVGNFQNESAFVSVFGRFIYDYQDKYLLTATVRHDGSSRFGAEQRWGTFPAVSAGWRVSEEAFLADLTQITNLKFRAGWGVSGSDNTSLYQWQSRIGSGGNQEYVFNGGVVPGAILTRLANPFLGWEEIEMFNIGLDVGLFNQRLEVTIDYFDKTTNGMLLAFAPALEVGAISNPTGNLGEINNKGIELAIHSVNVATTDFSWTSDFNISSVRNEVISLPENADRFNGPNITRVGEEIGALFGFETNGLFQTWDDVYSHAYQNQAVIDFDEDTGLPNYNTTARDVATGLNNTAPGDIRFVDQNDDGFVDADNDRVVIGSTIPDFTWGLSNNLSYKGISLSIFFQGVHGSDLYNSLRVRQERLNESWSNRRATVLNRWTGEGTSNSFPRAVFTDPNSNERRSDRWVEDGSFVRLKNVRLSYQLPASLMESIGLPNSGVNFYAVGTNLLTFTNYSGFDPEVGLRNGGNPETAGVDNGVYPLTRQYTVGLQVSF